MSRKAASPSPPRMWTSECLFSRTAVMMEERRWEGRRKRWRNERCGIKKGMRVVEASKEEQWKGGGGGRGGWGSDTALCVAMVQAQSELHSSFAAQLANYPQTAVLIRSSQSLLDFQELFFFFDFRTDTRAWVKEQFMYLYAEKCIEDVHTNWKCNPKRMCCGYVANGIIERCSGALLRQPCHLCNIKSSSSPELHCPLTVAAYWEPADPDQPAYKTQYGPLWINFHH